MTTFRLAGAVAALITIAATPVLAQQVISEPGYCAQFYPNANCQNKGASNPHNNGGYYRDNGLLNSKAGMYQSRRWHRRQHQEAK